MLAAMLEPCMSTTRRSIAMACAAAALALTCGPIAAAESRAHSLARFDAGYAQCEQRYPAMRGQRDKAYAGVWRLRWDDATREQLSRARKTKEYKIESQRATRKLAASAAASDVSQRLDQQCLVLQREAAK
jgi:hypothetical protein